MSNGYWSHLALLHSSEAPLTPATIKTTQTILRNSQIQFLNSSFFYKILCFQILSFNLFLLTS